MQSQKQDRKAGKLDGKRIQRLEEIGFIWDHRTEFWEAGYSYLAAFKEKHGNCRVSQSYKIEGYRLGTWVHNLRKAYKKGKLEEKRIQRLEDIGFIWEPSKKTTS